MTNSTDHCYASNCENNEVKTMEKEGGLDALFDLSFFQKEGQDTQMSQFITKKSDNGQLFTMKIPGETRSGCQLVRLDLYDVRDVSKKDKRHWWKCAKLRSQFLLSSSSADRKQQLLRQLLDCTTNDLKKLPGVKRESRSPNYDAGTSS